MRKALCIAIAATALAGCGHIGPGLSKRPEPEVGYGEGASGGGTGQSGPSYQPVYNEKGCLANGGYGDSGRANQASQGCH